MTTAPLLTVDQVAKYIFLADGDKEAAGIRTQVLTDLCRGLNRGDTNARTLRAMYETSYHIVVGRDPDAAPDDSLMADMIAANPGCGYQLLQHFLALGVLDGIRDANPTLTEYVTLSAAYSLGQDYSRALEVIASGPRAIST